MRNLRLALRTLAKTPFVSLVAILSLALGLGANSAIFSLFNQILLRPLPVPEPEALVNLGAPGPKPGSTSCNQSGDCDQVFSYPMFRDLERVQASFTGIAAHRTFSANVAFGGQTESGRGVLVSGSYFPVLGIQPAAGRLFAPEDDQTPGGHPLVVLSHDYWRRRFQENPAVLGQTLIVNGHGMTIVGVTPRAFEGTTLGVRPAVFVPVTMRAEMQPGPEGSGFENRRGYWVYLFARLKPGITLEAARVALNGPYRAIVNEVEAPLQKGMSDQTMARFREKALTMEAGARGQSDVHGEARAPLADPLRRDRHRAADRLRQHREPAAGTWRRACRRDGRAPVRRGQPRAVDPAVVDRVGDAGPARRRLRRGRREVDARHHCLDRAPRGRGAGRVPSGSGDAGLCRGHGLRHRCAVRPVSGPALDQPGARRHAQEPGGPAVRREGRQALQGHAGHGANRDVDGPARARRPLCQEPVQRQPSRVGSQVRPRRSRSQWPRC